MIIAIIYLHQPLVDVPHLLQYLIENLKTMGKAAGTVAAIYIGYKIVRAVAISFVATPVAGAGSLALL